MVSRVSALAAALVRRRVAVVSSTLTLALAHGLASPPLRVRFDPRDLVAGVGDDPRPAPDVLLFVVQADDVLAAPVLRWMHALARDASSLPRVAAVESVTTSALPHFRERAPETLEDLGDDPGSDALDGPIARAVRTSPERFPAGLATLASRAVGPLVVAPLVGDAPLDDARALEVAALLRELRVADGALVSRDHRVALIALVADAALDDAEGERFVEAAARLAEASALPTGVSASLAGLPAMRSEMRGALRGDQLRLALLAAFASVLVLVFGLRSTAGVAVPMITVGVAVSATMGALALWGEPLTLLTNVLPPLLVTIGLADAVHLVIRYRDELRSSGDREAAAATTLVTMWRACFVTSLTTAIGFGALMLTETPILQRFGATTALAVMATWVVTVVLVPAMLPFFSGRERIAAGRDAVRRSLGLLDAIVQRLAQLAVGVPRRVVAGATLLALIAGALATQLDVDSRVLDQFAADSPTTRTTQLLERDLGGVRTASLELSAAPGYFTSAPGLARIAEIRAMALQTDGVLGARSVVDAMEMAWALMTGEDDARGEALADPQRALALRELVRHPRTDALSSRDGTRARIELSLGDIGARRTIALLERLRDFASDGGVEARLGGEAWRASQGLVRITGSRARVALAVGAVVAVIALSFRSVRLGVLAIPPNVLPLVLTLGYMELRGVPVHAATILVLTVTVGLSVDGVTHVLARVRERVRLETEADVVETMSASGRGVVLASATLLVGFAALCTSAFEPVRLFGELSMIAIATSIAAQLVLVPALLALAMRKRVAHG